MNNVEINDNKRETRLLVGKIMLFACIGISTVIVICNIFATLPNAQGTNYLMESYNPSFIDNAWMATLFWAPVGWIPNIIADVLVRKCGKKFLILKIISWALYLFVGPTGICNPIPQSA